MGLQENVKEFTYILASWTPQPPSPRPSKPKISQANIEEKVAILKKHTQKTKIVLKPRNLFITQDLTFLEHK